MTFGADRSGDYHDWKGWAEKDFGSYSTEDAAYYKVEVFDRVGLSHGARILEIGFGNGCFMGCARAAGFSVTGTEINPELRRRALASDFDVIETLHGLAAGTFDAVVMFDVLEHLSNDAAVKLLREIGGCVKPGGFVVLRFPNGDSPFGLVHQYGDVTHINVIGSIKIGYFAGESGLSVVALSNQATPFHHLSVRHKARRWVRVALRGCIEELFGRTFYSGRRPLATNLIAVLQRPT